MKEQIWQSILKVRNLSPLVHNITNYVVMNNTANALLAAGASPVMAHAPEEVEEMVAIAGSLVVNIGTLSKSWVAAMEKAMKKARELDKPIIFDPVGMGATTYRNEVTEHLLKTVHPTVIRGNASEISAIYNKDQKTKGVDSTLAPNQAVDAANYLHQNFKSVVCVSGPADLIISHDKKVKLKNGVSLMGKITGMGCTATALIGAFTAVEKDTFLATVSAMALLGVAGELAMAYSKGPGSLQVNILDKLSELKEDEFMQTILIEED